MKWAFANRGALGKKLTAAFHNKLVPYSFTIWLHALLEPVHIRGETDAIQPSVTANRRLRVWIHAHATVCSVRNVPCIAARCSMRSALFAHHIVRPV